MRIVLRLALVAALTVVLVPLPPAGAAVAVAHESVSEVLDGLPEQDGTAPGASSTPQPLRSEPMPTPLPFSMVGFELPADAELEFRTSSDGIEWSSWEPAEVLDGDDGPDPGTPEARRAPASTRMTEPHWTGEALHLQLQVRGGSPEDVAVHLIDSNGLSRSLSGRALDAVRHAWRGSGQARPVEAALAQPAVVSRAGWRADEGLRRAEPSFAPTVSAATVHHTAGGNTYTRADAPAVVRGIYHYHTQSLGWNDVGYNALVDRYGTIYEGRHGGLERAVIGAHAGGFNTGTFGIAVMGEFTAAAPPAAALRSLEAMLAWKLDHHRVDPLSEVVLTSGGSTRHARGAQVRLPAVFGHREVSATACPGDAFFARLPSLRLRTFERIMTLSSAVPLSGDWNGDGRMAPGWFLNGTWYVRNSLEGGPSYTSFAHGRRGDRPVVGDWDGDGIDGIGVVRDRQWYLRETASAGPADHRFFFGKRGDEVFAGDWNGDGRDGPGVRRENRFFLRDELTTGAQQHPMITYGRAAGDVLVFGDPLASGRDLVGIRRNHRWYFHDGGRTAAWFDFGAASDRPLMGHWTGPTAPGAAVVRRGRWFVSTTTAPGSSLASQLSFRYGPF